MKQRIVLCMLSAAFAFTGFKYVERVYPKVITDCEVAVLNDSSSFRFYEVTDLNKMRCDLSTASLVIRNMLCDGFTVCRELNAEDSIDIILQKDELLIRIVFEADGSFTSIADAYEKSYLPFTYISEGSSN